MAIFMLTFLFAFSPAVFATGTCNATTTFSLANADFAAARSTSCSFESGPFSFSITNPLSRELRFYASQYLQCNNYYRLGAYSFFPPPYSNPNGTNASSIAVAQAPCILEPCCVIVQCRSAAGCPNITLKSTWSNATSPYNPYIPYTRFRSEYVYGPVGGTLGFGGLSYALLRITQQCKNKKDNEADVPDNAEPISPGATEETPVRVRVGGAGGKGRAV